ncbi:hypothetical protein [Phenylobacterium sp.]|uniref:hypothetical protein n=1 Tax=Phenylobacterium sp. TaxID=1871053 RepID=UPI00301C8F48
MDELQQLTDQALLEAILAAEAAADAQAKALRRLKDEYLHRKRDAVAKAYAEKGSQFGVVHIEEAGCKIDVTTAPRVEWDQEELAKLVETIRDDWGSDPYEYIDRKLTIKESKYKAWPSDLKASFEPARTVKPSAPSLSVTRSDGSE